MSKVEMSLKEYDELMDKLRKYERLVNQLTTPSIDEWDYNYFKNNLNSSLTIYGRVTDKDLIDFLEEEVLNNVSSSKELFSKLGSYEPEFDISRILLFRVDHEEGEVIESGEG